MYANTGKCVPLTDFSLSSPCIMVISTSHSFYKCVSRDFFLFEFIDKKLKCYHFKWQSNPLKSIINRLKRVTNGELRFKFSLFVSNSEFETSPLVWCFIKRCLSDSCESTCADYFKKIRILFYINNSRTCTILIQTLTK